MDFDKYGYYEDVREKKKAAYGARHVKRHTGCMLPFETMSKKELKAMNGPVIKFDLTQPMDFAKFRTLKDSQKRIQLEVYGKHYGWTSAAVGKVLGVQQGTAYKNLKRLGLLEKFKEEKAKTTAEKAAEQKRALALIPHADEEDEADEPNEEAALEQGVQPVQQLQTPEDNQPSKETKTAPQAQNEGPTELGGLPGFEITFNADNAAGSAIAKRLAGILASIDDSGRYSLQFRLKEI